MLVDDIAKNRRRMQTILKRLPDAEGTECLLLTIKELSREELLSERQHLKLAKTMLEQELDSSRIVAVIKDTKIC